MANNTIITILEVIIPNKAMKIINIQYSQAGISIKFLNLLYNLLNIFIHLCRNTMRPLVKSYVDISTSTLSPAKILI